MACGSEQTPASADGFFREGTSSVDGIWAVVEVDGEPVEVGVNAAEPPYLEIGGAEIEGHLGCNGGGGRLVAKEGTLVVSEFFRTAAGCMPDSLMFVEHALADVLDRGDVPYRLSRGRMIWEAAGHTIVFEPVSTPPTITWPDPPPQHQVGPLDCGGEATVDEIRRIAHEGRTPLEIAASIDADVVEVEGLAPLQWAGLDGDGIVRVLVFVHDDGTGDFQVMYCTG